MNKLNISALLSLLALINLASAAHAGPVHISSPFGAFNVEAKSHKEMRWDTVVRQQYDYSCGSAAVATLLTYHYDRPTTETEVYQAMIRNGDQQRIQAQGFSMLDMKRYLDSLGLNSDGFNISLDDFIKVGMPAITLVNTGGYRHFVVVKGFVGEDVLLGDPAVGTVAIPIKNFASIWSGTVLGARQDMQTAKRNYNSSRDWKIRPKAPLGQGIDRSSAGTAPLTLPGRLEIGK